jgi:hypothetical protein
VRQRGAGEPDRAHEHPVVRRVPCAVVGLGEAQGGGWPAVDDQHVEPAQQLDGAPDELLDVGGRAEVGGHAAGRPDLGGRGLEPALVARGDHDPRALGGEGGGARPAEPLARGGDQRPAAGEIEIHG